MAPDSHPNALTVRNTDPIAALADEIAARHVFSDYAQRKAPNTLRRHRVDLAAFAEYLGELGISVAAEALQRDPDVWRDISWGLVTGFREWLLRQGFATSTVNARLSAVKTYAALAFQAGALTHEQATLIAAVRGYSSTESRHVDEKRAEAGAVTRRAGGGTNGKGAKKAQAVSLSSAQRRWLKTHPDTPQGRRDALLMCLLLDHGLRCGEITALTVRNVDLDAGELRFFRPKVSKVQVHRLTPDTLKAMRAWFEHGDALDEGPLLRASRKGGQLTTSGMSERAITKRVNALGQRIGIEGLSAHDGRHSWATQAARNGTNPFTLQEAGGWASLATPRRYIEEAKIANDGVKLEE